MPFLSAFGVFNVSWNYSISVPTAKLLSVHHLGFIKLNLGRLVG